MILDVDMAAKHILGATNIVKSCGGVGGLGISEIVHTMLKVCIYGKGLFGTVGEVS